MSIVTMIVCDSCGAVWNEKAGYGGRPVHAIRKDATRYGWLVSRDSLERRASAGHRDFCTKCARTQPERSLP